MVALARLREATRTVWLRSKSWWAFRQFCFLCFTNYYRNYYLVVWHHLTAELVSQGPFGVYSQPGVRTEFGQYLLVPSSRTLDWALSAWVIGGSKVRPRYRSRDPERQTKVNEDLREIFQSAVDYSKRRTYCMPGKGFPLTLCTPCSILLFRGTSRPRGTSLAAGVWARRPYYRALWELVWCCWLYTIF